MKPFAGGPGSFRNRPQSIGVRLSDRPIETTTAPARVRANSRIKSPTTPPMNISGVNTAISEIEIDRMVKAISPEPAMAAASGVSPASIRFQITSSMTMASSTTKPTAMVIAISDRLSRLKPATSITAAVPRSDNGITTLGISVARTLRRNRKITPTTSTMVISRVIFTSLTEARMVWVRSARICTPMAGGISACSDGSAALIRSTVWITLAPGCLNTISRMALPASSDGSVLALPGNAQAPIWLFSTSWTAVPRSFTRIGAPLW